MITNYLDHYLLTINKHYLNDKQRESLAENGFNINSTITIIQWAQDKIINEINDQYFEKLELDTSFQPIKDNNAILYSIAIFMQLIGLILVLSRDLARQ